MSDVRLPPPHVLRHCRLVTRTRARNFYYGLKLLPEPQRTALYAMYAWMRRADDLVDNEHLAPEQKHAQLSAFRAHTDRAIAGDPPSDDPMWAGVAFVAQHFAIQPSHLHAMLDGQLEDLSERSFDSFKSLQAYCYKVASTVGLVCIEIWGYSDSAAPELAVSRGIAFQLTNILRDFREDFDNGRLYLPAEELAEHGLTPDALRRWTQPDACSKLLRRQIERAEMFYEQSAALDGMITPACRATLWAMTTIYRTLLDKIKADPSRIVAPQRLRLSALQKAKIAVQAKWLLPPPPAEATVEAGAR